MTTFYRIKHLPPGLYFCPSRSIKVKLQDDLPYYAQMGRYIKSNLSKHGKAYLRKPSIKQIGSHYYTHVWLVSAHDLDHGVVGEYKMLPVVDSEWQIEQNI